MEVNNSPLNYFVIIGGSQSQVPFIQTAQRLGYKTVVFDRNASSPGSAIADKFYAISTHDIDTISYECYKMHKDKSLYRIMHVQLNRRIFFLSDSHPLVHINIMLSSG